MVNELKQDLRSLEEIVEYLCFRDSYTLKRFLGEKQVPCIINEEDEYVDMNVLCRIVVEDIQKICGDIDGKLEGI